MNAKKYLVCTYEILNAEYDMLKMIAEELRSQGKYYAADNVDDTRKDLLKAVFSMKESLECIDGSSHFEQINMNI